MGVKVGGEDGRGRRACTREAGVRVMVLIVKQGKEGGK